jgi:hypothetical protein
VLFGRGLDWNFGVGERRGGGEPIAILANRKVEPAQVRYANRPLKKVKMNSHISIEKDKNPFFSLHMCDPERCRNKYSEAERDGGVYIDRGR